MKIGGIILAGGLSSRLGRDKAAEKLGGMMLLERAVRAVAPLCAEIVIVGRKHMTEPLPDVKIPVRMLEDIVPRMGPMGGLYTGLTVSSMSRNLVIACDMPFLRPELLLRLRDEAEDAEAVVPIVGNTLQPLCARYSVNCLKEIDSLIREGHYSIWKLFSRVRTHYIEMDDPAPFLDIDTDADLAQARSRETDG